MDKEGERVGSGKDGGLGKKETEEEKDRGKNNVIERIKHNVNVRRC